METTIIQSDYELERQKPMPSKNHGLIQGNIYFELRSKYSNRFKIIPEARINFKGDEKVPDLAIFESLEFTPENDEITINKMPLATIEILSPKQHLSDLIIKAHLYFEAGIQSYWLVLPDLKTIYVYSAIGEYEVFSKQEVLKDLKLDIELSIEAIFR
jgi:Uma2 family endonuclease